MVREPEYISLKEAAQISGYTADYIGQLIRSGKLPGKQVFLNVAWMTTREALQEYANKSEKSETVSATLRERVLSYEGLTFALRIASWVTAVLLICIALFLVFVFASSIDERLEARSLQSIEYE